MTPRESVLVAAILLLLVIVGITVSAFWRARTVVHEQIYVPDPQGSSEAAVWSASWQSEHSARTSAEAVEFGENYRYPEYCPVAFKEQGYCIPH